MLPREVFERVGKLPGMSLDQGLLLYDFITKNRLHNILELGFSQGVSAAYLAGAIEDLGSGLVTAIGLSALLDRHPNIDSVLDKTGLSHLVRVCLEPRSVNWRLMKMLKEDCRESYDFSYMASGYNWYETGFAFCIVERLVKPGGWVVFDDLHFTYRESIHRDKPWVRRMPEEEQVTPQVERVFDLLVASNPNFGSFRRMGRLAFAQKRRPEWPRELRDQNEEDLIVCRALGLAHSDPEFREALFLAPSETISSLACLPTKQFSHLRFVESDSIAPVSSEIAASGETVIYVERASWDRAITEDMLQKMLDD